MHSVLNRIAQVGRVDLAVDLKVKIPLGDGACRSLAIATEKKIVLEKSCYSDAAGVARQFALAVGSMVAQQNLQSYAKANLGRCPLAPGRNSSAFATIFLAYLAAPRQLQSECSPQFEWMRQNVFRGGTTDPVATCGVGTPATIVRSPPPRAPTAPTAAQERARPAAERMRKPSDGDAAITEVIVLANSLAAGPAHTVLTNKENKRRLAEEQNARAQWTAFSDTQMMQNSSNPHARPIAPPPPPINNNFNPGGAR